MALTWTTPTLNAGFVGNIQYSTETPTGAGAAYVSWRGQLTGAVGKVAFTVGAGSRPGQNAYYEIADAAGLRIAQLFIDTSGNVTVMLKQVTGNEPVTVSVDGLVTRGEA